MISIIEAKISLLKYYFAELLDIIISIWFYILLSFVVQSISSTGQYQEILKVLQIDVLQYSFFVFTWFILVFLANDGILDRLPLKFKSFYKKNHSTIYEMIKDYVFHFLYYFPIHLIWSKILISFMNLLGYHVDLIKFSLMALVTIVFNELFYRKM